MTNTMTHEQLALSAAEGANRFAAMVRQVDKVELDYTRDSVDRLSALVSSKRGEWLRAMNETQRHRFTELMGCYFGECVRRLHEGSWVWMGQDAAVQVSGTSEIHFALPFSNVQSHLQIGDEKSLAVLYRGFEALVRGDGRH